MALRVLDGRFGFGIRKGFRLGLFLGLLLLSPLAAFTSDRQGLPGMSGSLDLPPGWTLLESTPPQLYSFTDSTHTAVIQVFQFPGKEYGLASDLMTRLKHDLQAQGEDAPFRYSGKDSCLTDLTFTAGRFPVRGYALAINGEAADTALIAYTPLTHYEKNHDALLSALDSFAPDRENENLPGPLSQFLSPLSKTAAEDVTQTLIEREARLLAVVREGQVPAWHRFFRMIYRDSYHRMDDFLSRLNESLGVKALKREDAVRKLLKWVQDFSYGRTGSLGDLLSPQATAATHSGDCDSRGLLMVILLHHLGIDAVLLVSSRYQHSAIAVDMEGAGARIDVNGRRYLFAEVTDKVEPGMVAADMADPAGWIVMALGSPAAP